MGTRAGVWRVWCLGDGRGVGWGVKGVDGAWVGGEKPDLGLKLIGKEEP